jgi:ribonucleoside-diphosphate reductase alpha chain
MNTLQQTLYVIKRNGQTEEVSFDKVIRRIKKLCINQNYDPIINPLLIAQKVCSQIYDNVSTCELDELAAQICISMITVHLDYGKLASRIIISNNQKNTSPSFSEVIQNMFENKDINGVECSLVSKKLYDVVMLNKDKLNSVIDYDRDFLFDYFGFKTLEKAYLIKIKGKPVERIQHMFMRVSLGIHGPDIKSAIMSYQLMSMKYFIHATPTLYNSGTNNNQLASCFLLGMNDSVDGIFKCIKDIALISKGAGGIGLHMHKIRSKNSYIRSTNGTSNGIIPLCKVLNETARYINQGGKRPGSIAVYLEPHYPEIMEFLNIRKNTGAESERARDLFTAMWISDLFMKRVHSNGDWSLFDPDECPRLEDTYGEEFEELYAQYEKEGKARNVIPARKVWNAILSSQIETGTPYILYKDNINKKSNQKNVGIIRSSNLCAEIVEYSDANEYSVCTLASVSLSTFVKEENEIKSFDFDKLIEVMDIMVKNLNKVIDNNYYPVEETRVSNLKHRPIGIGIQGLADVFAKMKMPFDSPEAATLNRQIFETMYFGAMKSSHQLAKRDGAYSTFRNSPISEGVFQFDLWNEKPTMNYDWDKLKEDVKKDGVRNSLLIALMPTASTSQILGNNECFEPFTSNIYTRRTIAGDFVIINKYLVEDLLKIGLWNKEIKDMIIANNGSVQSIDSIPQDIKNLYKTVWEIKQKALIDLSIGRGPFVCQTQSMNLFFEEPTTEQLTSAFFYSWKKGLKTGCYYIRTRPKVQAQQFTIDPTMVKAGKKEVEETEGGCEMCSG